MLGQIDIVRLLCTWPEGAYEGATADGKQALLTRPEPSPLRYSTLPCGGALPVLHVIRQTWIDAQSLRHELMLQTQ